MSLLKNLFINRFSFLYIMLENANYLVEVNKIMKIKSMFLQLHHYKSCTGSLKG